MLRLAPKNRAVLPRWGINSPIRDRGADPGQYTGTIGWTSREHYLTVIVPAALAARPDVLRQHHVSAEVVQRWAEAKSLYAQEPRSGRRVIVRPQTLAGLLPDSLSGVHRAQRVARDLGLEIVITEGRMLSEFEVYAARKKGSPQRGLSTVSAFVVPVWMRSLVERDTPTSGDALSASVTYLSTFKQRCARSKGAPLRSAPPQQKSGSPRKLAQNRSGPAWDLAVGLTKQVIFLHRCPPGRIVGQLRRFSDPKRTGGMRWTTKRVLDAMEQVNRRLGYAAPVQAKTAPWGLLAWYLGQIDPYADHPDNDQPMIRSVPWCGECASETFRWVEDPTTHDPVSPCPRCSPQASR